MFYHLSKLCWLVNTQRCFLSTCSTRFWHALAYPSDRLAVVFARHPFVKRFALVSFYFFLSYKRYLKSDRREMVAMYHPTVASPKEHKRTWSNGGAVVRALASHQCGTGSNPGRRRHMWVEFVVGSLLCSERFLSGYSGFPLSSKTNIFKFQFDQESGRRRTTMWMCYLLIVIYLFYYTY